MTDYSLDWQSQLDEVLALSSIYEDDFTITSVTLDTNQNSSSPSSSVLNDVESTLEAESLLALPEPQGEWSIKAELAVHCSLPAHGYCLRMGASGRASTNNQNITDNTKSTSKDAATSESNVNSTNSNSNSNSNSSNCNTEAESLFIERDPSTLLSYSIAHLPPIMLRFTFQPGYPSQQAPTLSLSALWLSAAQITLLQQHLIDVVWNGEGFTGLPVCYSWADWLAHSALEFLGLQEGFILEPRRYSYDAFSAMSPQSSLTTLDNENYNKPCLDAEQQRQEELETSFIEGQSEDQGEWESAEAQLLVLLRYNAARDHQLFQRSSHTCTICFEEQYGTVFTRLDCGHYFCCTCLKELCKTHVAEGSLDALKCPQPSCGKPLEPHTLRLLLSVEDYGRWDQLTLQRALDSMADACYCPRCGALALEDEDNHAACPKCMYDFCSLCNEARHPGVKCVSAETKLEMLRRKAAGGGPAAVAELRRKEQDYLSMSLIEKSAKPCPRCGIAIERSSGCNKMTCTNCSAYFCFKCGAEIRGYDHYKEGSACILFDEAEVLRWERQWQGEVERHMLAGLRNDIYGQFHAAAAAAAAEADFGQGGNGAQVQPGGGRQRPLVRGGHHAANCPQCGQLNYKIARNNHIHCFSCARHFCAVCRMVLQGRGGTHYKPGGCKQHS